MRDLTRWMPVANAAPSRELDQQFLDWGSEVDQCVVMGLVVRVNLAAQLFRSGIAGAIREEVQRATDRV